jgi:hypothetical protein
MGADMCASEREKPPPGAATIKQYSSARSTKEMLDDLRESKEKRRAATAGSGPSGLAGSGTAAVSVRARNQAGRLSPINEAGRGTPDPPWVHETRAALSIEFDKGTELMSPTPTAEALACFENVVGRVDTALKEHQADTSTDVFREFVTKKCRSLGNMGLFYDKRFQFADAVGCYKRCYEAAMLVECDLALAGNVTNNIAAANFNNGKAEEALKWFALSRQHWSVVAAGQETTVGSAAALSLLTDGEVTARRNKAKKKIKVITRQIKTMRDIAKIDKMSSDSKK